MTDTAKLAAFVDQVWDQEIIPTLTDYIRIPNKSPMFDPDWAAHGYMDRAVALFEAWARPKVEAIPGATIEVIRLDGRTPVIFAVIPGDGPTTLLYGHLDKQPEMTGWAEGFGPWEPVIKDGKLYGRGGADDGYALFGALTAIMGLREQGIAHGRCVILIEACEESGSYDLPFYVEHLAERIGQPSLVICLDSGCGNYDQLWLTTSLRGLTGGTLKVEVLEEGVHSGSASGIVPSSFRILRQLIARIEDQDTGQVRPDAFAAEIPAARVAQANKAAEALGEEVWRAMPFIPGMRPVTDDPTELLLNRTWRPQLAVTGAAGLPPIENAGNVLRPFTTAKLSLRLPPTADAEAAGDALKALLERDPPYGAKISFTPDHAGAGWNAPDLAPWLEASLERASTAAFGKPAAMIGEGGSIPFMGMLGERFPAAQFVITGVLGPHSNAHGPNEFLHIQMGKNVTACMAMILEDHVKAMG
ncbi:M20 family metallopeptidase [Phenylobacterium montanum]|uniref:M20 family metallopeptidase n=1 Tax=Phenylobacterium montanum TaxID=2823693 RepID=A0A975IWI7_9CAUL|nr:M20 family metallopeptidase [Caulobacter sp. S6]QUD90122.1 M20 family metallopeptidase [Caulobacter sp. S6]